jgi:hypothetical protein
MPDPATGNGGRLRRYNKNSNLIFENVVPHGYKDMVIDGDGNIYLAGDYGSIAIEIDGKKFTTPPDFYWSYQYVIKYNSAGELLWYKIITSGNPNISLSIDKKLNLYVTTSVQGDVTANKEPLTTGNGLLLAKFSTDGALIWKEIVANTFLNTANPHNCFVGQNEIVFVVGDVLGKVLFGNYQVTSQTDMYCEMFVAKLSQGFSVNLKENRTSDQLWNIFPNPSGDVFSIQGYSDEVMTISVTDARGQLVRSETPQGKNKQVDLSAFSPGVYLLQIKAGDRRETKKLVKN